MFLDHFSDFFLSLCLHSNAPSANTVSSLRFKASTSAKREMETLIFLSGGAENDRSTAVIEDTDSGDIIFNLVKLTESPIL